MKKIILAAFLGISMISGAAFASVIYDNGGPDISGVAFYNDATYPNFRSADNFILQSGSNTITDIHWWGGYDDNIAFEDDFSIVIYDTPGPSSLPGNSVYTNNTATVNRSNTGLQILNSIDIYYYSVFIDPVTLTPGDTFWLEVLNSTPLGSWVWVTTDDIDGRASWSSFLGYWTPQNYDFAFNLTNDAAPVPEPSTFLLLGAGLLGLAAVAIGRRRKE